MDLKEAEKRIERLEEEMEIVKVQRDQLRNRFAKLETLLREVRDDFEGYFDDGS